MSFQLRTSNTIKFFDRMFRNKFNFEKYRSLDNPVLFFGLYRHSDFQALERHKGVKVAWFAGTDALMALDAFKKGDFDIHSYLKDAIVIAESHWIEKDLEEMEIKYKSISLFIDDLYAWKPVPLGDSLYWYGGNTTKFKKQYLPIIRKAFPDLNIIIHDKGNLLHEEMVDVYKKCFVNIRPIDHDGMSQTVAEMGLMGRISIHNSNLPCTLRYNDINDVIEIIKKLRKGYNPKIISKRTRGFFIENETKWTDLVLNLCGLEEMDYLGIFNKSVGRCGSIFRIQRTSDIKKIGGLGNSQFQRPWFSEQLNNLGKYELLVSKPSGYTASEWKNTDSRKGFPEGVNFNTRDRGTI